MMEKELKPILSLPPFGTNQEEKERLYLSYMRKLTEHHRLSCREYGRILDILDYNGQKAEKLEDIPMLPVSLFKEMSLSSIKKEEIFKTVTSSGTTGQVPSRIVLDSRTASLQQQVLASIVGDFIGKERLPMLIIDSRAVLRDRQLFSARGAGIMGFSVFSRERCFALDENMKLNLEQVKEFLEKHRGKKVLVFGFTYMIWSCFYKELKARGEKLDLSEGFLIHGGGWKKLKKEAVSQDAFAEGLYEVSKIAQISNYYGMAEQTGTIYMECSHHHLHVSSYSEVLFRNMRDFSLCRPGEEGVIQVISPIALSYPGHSLLTEDKGCLLGTDDCPCGRKGKYFSVTGRTERSEIRGCSDVYGG